MATTINRRAHAGVLTIVFVLTVSVGLFGQSRPVARDLNATLYELTRVAPATVQDLDVATQQQQGGKLHWVTFWRGDKYDPQLVEALRRNLRFAVPNLIHDAQTSGGSLFATFKLYKDLTVVCQSLDSLLPPGSRESKAELIALNRDLSDMNQLREELSSYIEQTAASIDTRGPRTLSSAGQAPKKIIVDDTIPDSPSAKKRRSSN